MQFETLLSNKIIYLILLYSLLATSPLAAEAEGLSPNEQLGKAVFFDLTLSRQKNQACFSCHAPNTGWTGPDSKINLLGSVYPGSIISRFGQRKPPSSAYAASSPVLYLDKEEGHFVGGNFWDGRATGHKLGNPAADQAQGPFLNPVEQALSDAICVVYKVCHASYPYSLENQYPGVCDITWPKNVNMDKECSLEKVSFTLSEKQKKKVEKAFDAIALSIAAYEASSEVNPYTSKYDYFAKGKIEFTDQEKQGLLLFNEKGECADCHVLEGKKPIFTDFTYDNLGVPKNPENPVYKTQPKFVDKGLAGFLETITDRKKWRALAKESLGKHKVPTLRNVDKRPSADFVKAYMHNGYFKTLKGVVNFYNTRDTKPACKSLLSEAEAMAAGCWPEPEVKENVNKEELGDLGLTDEEENAIVAFMKTLSDGFILNDK